jgi:branched-chain amino acid transport system permease protein
MTPRLSARIGLFAVAALLAMVMPWVDNDYFTRFAFTLVVWITLSESWTVVSGITNYISLGYIVFVALGAAVTTLIWTYLPVQAILPLTALSVILLAALVGYAARARKDAVVTSAKPGLSVGTGLSAVAAMLVIELLWIADKYSGELGFTLLVWIALAVSWVVVIATMTGFISLGPVVFVGLGAYITALIWTYLPLWATLPLAVLLAGVVGRLCTLVRGPSVAVPDFGVLELAKSAICKVRSAAALSKAARVSLPAPALNDLLTTTVGRRLSARTGLVMIAALLAIALPWLGNEYYTGFGFTLVVWIALTESWIIISGMTGYVSLGHVVFVGLGAYVTALTWTYLPLWAILPLSGLSAALLAGLIGYPCLRVRGPYFVILTFGVSELIKFIVINIESALSMSGRVLFAAPDINELFFIGLALAAASIAAAVFVSNSRFGSGLLAIRENEEAAETIGIAVSAFKLSAFVLSAIIPGMVGVLLILRSTYFEPLQIFNPQTSVLIVTMAVIGGSDRPVGPLLGVGLLVVLQELLWARLPQLYMIIVGVLLIAVVIWVPGGVYGRLRQLIPAIAR